MLCRTTIQILSLSLDTLQFHLIIKTNLYREEEYKLRKKGIERKKEKEEEMECDKTLQIERDYYK